MDKLKVLLVAGVVALVVASVVTYFRPNVNTIREVVKELGSVTGPDSFFPVVSNEGIKTHYRRQQFQTGSTTRVLLCQIQTPTSTVITSLGARINGLATSSGRLAFYLGATEIATTTVLAGSAGDVTATGTLVVATTTLAANAAVLDAAGDAWITLDYESASVPYLAMEGATGFCSATFQEY